MALKDSERRINVKEYLTIRKREKITLPKSIIRKLDLQEGDQLEVEINDRGEMKLVPTIQVPEDQAWFWTEEWQKDEKEADEDIKAGRVKSFENVDEVLHWLESDEADNWAKRNKDGTYIHKDFCKKI